MYDQVKSGFPRDLAEASLLTRIAPLPVLGKLLHLPMKGKMATFAFSHLGKSSYQHPVFMEKRIANMFHMPRVPVPPGSGSSAIITTVGSIWSSPIWTGCSAMKRFMLEAGITEAIRRCEGHEYFLRCARYRRRCCRASAAVAAARGGARTMLVEKEHISAAPATPACSSISAVCT